MPNSRRCTNACALVAVLILTGYSARDTRAVPSFGYQLPLSFPVGPTARLVAHADLNGDGKEDLVFAGQSAHERERGVEILEGNGDGTFRKGVTIDLQTPTAAIAVADVNGDGKPDLILLHPGVTVLLNTTPYSGAPVSFGSEQSLMGGFGPALAAADLNGDGKAEVLVGTTPSRDARDETGTLRIATAPAFIDASHHAGTAPLVEIPIPGVPVSIAIGDFDGDAKPDVAVGFRGQGRERRGGVVVLLNRTESASTPIRFADPIVVQFDHAVNFVAAGDLNGDGRNDIFAAWCSSGTEQCGAVSLMSSPGAEGAIRFTSQSVSLGVDRAANWILQDVNHDGKPELLFLNRLSGVAVHYGAPAEIVVALGLGNGKFAPPRTFSAPTLNSLGMVLADFNRDGHADLAVLDAASAESGRIRVLLGQQGGGFHGPESLITGFAPAAVIPVSEHGRTAGFVVTGIPQNGLASSASKAGRTAEVFAGESLNPPYAPLYTVSGVPDGAIAVGDLNGDGRTEMVVVTASGIEVYALEGKSRNHPIQAAKFPATGNRFGAAVPQRAILQDVNGDGKPDLIVGNGYDRSLQVYINTGAKAFSFANPVQVPWCPRSVPPPIMKGFVSLSLELATADINGDGKPDLVVNGYCGLTVMLNRMREHGDVTFDVPVPVVDVTGQPLRPQGVTLADVNRDGKIDLIVTENNYSANGGESSAVDVFLNQTTSSPTFRLAQQLTIGKRVPSVVAADFDQDGWPDLAIVDAVDGTLTFFLNDGQWKSKGGFAMHSSFTVMPGPQQLLVIDTPGGGLPRLLLRNKDLAAIVQ
jgi:hypothetical protein